MSGRITATLPWPAAVTDLRLAIVVKFLVNVVTVTVAPPEELPEVVVVDDELLLPQAATSRPPANRRGTRARLFVNRMLFPLLPDRREPVRSVRRRVRRLVRRCPGPRPVPVPVGEYRFTLPSPVGTLGPDADRRSSGWWTREARPTRTSPGAGLPGRSACWSGATGE